MQNIQPGQSERVIMYSVIFNKTHKIYWKIIKIAINHTFPTTTSSLANSCTVATQLICVKSTK